METDGGRASRSTSLEAALERLAKQRRELAQCAIHADRSSVLPPSPFQEGLWFEAVLNPDSIANNIEVALRLSGPLDEDAFAASIKAIVVRHEVLRTVLREVDGALAQVVQG